MKLIRIGESGVEKPGVELDNGERVDISSLMSDFDQQYFVRANVS